MARRTVQVNQDILTAGGITADEVGELLVLELYREGRVSLGRAAELAGMSLAKFMDFMAQHRTCVNYDERDLEEDRRTLPGS